MKTFTKTRLAFAFLLLTFSTTKAQDDLSGVYVDGIKTTELNCASFGDMYVVFPIDKLKSFESVNVYGSVEYNRDWQKTVGNANTYFKTASLDLKSFTYKNQTYVKISLIRKGNQESDYYTPRTSAGLIPYQLMRSSLSYDTKANFGTPKELRVQINGANAKGSTEAYDAGCNCIVKKPIYEATEYKVFYVTLKNSAKLGFAKSYDDTKVDLSQPCSVAGTKIDFENLGK